MPKGREISLLFGPEKAKSTVSKQQKKLMDKTEKML